MTLKSALFASALVLVAACSGGFGEQPPVRALALSGGAVTALGPTGYCIDPSASRAADGFAVIAACDGSARPPIDGLVTVQVGATGSAAIAGSEPAFRAFLDTRAGRSLLSRGGDADTVNVQGATGGAGRVTIVFNDTAPSRFPGIQSREWRAFVDLNGRLVTISVRGFVRAPLADFSGAALLDQAVAAMIAANAPQTPTDA